MTLLFSYKSIYKSYGAQPVFEDFSITLKTKERLGIVGSNGSGKSTLLRLIAGISSPEKGEKFLKTTTRLVYLAQEDNLDPDKTVQQTLLDSLSGEDMDDQERYRILRKMLGTGGFSDKNLSCSCLSGGWRKRLAITRALALKPDLLLLDEPTNHLDIDGIIWLEEILKNADFAFAAVSHDRCFLENTCHSIMELGRCYPKGYFRVNGGYSEFEKIRFEFLESQLKEEDSLANKMRRETQWLRQGAKARSTKARFRIEQAGKIARELAGVKSRNRQANRPDINFNASFRKTKKLLTCTDIGKSVEKRNLFENISFELLPGTCLGLIGENGSGKTTLMNILQGRTAPDTGKIKRADKLKIAVFNQNKQDLDPDMTLKEALSPCGESVIYRGDSIHVVSWAKKFLFTADQLSLPLRRLSGGEKTKILIADLMIQPADILLLDEPTNDLDIPSLEVLEQSLMDFPGAIVLVSHDRFLLKRLANTVLYLDGKGGSGIFADYNQWEKSEINTRKKKKEKKRKKNGRTVKNGEKVSKVNFSYKDKYELEHIEEKILSAEKNAAALLKETKKEKNISDPETLREIYTLLHNAQEKIEGLYIRWEELEALKAGKKSS